MINKSWRLTAIIQFKINVLRNFGGSGFDLAARLPVWLSSLPPPTSISQDTDSVPASWESVSSAFDRGFQGI